MWAYSYSGLFAAARNHYRTAYKRCRQIRASLQHRAAVPLHMF
jgi:hypothetical protein